MTVRSGLPLLVCFGVLASLPLIAQTQTPAHGFKVKTIGPAKEPPLAQQMFVPYWTLEPGWNTELEMRNNLAQQKLTVTPVLRTANGEEISLAAVTLDPDQSVSLDLQNAVGQNHPELANQVGSYGSVLFRFKGWASANMFAAAMVRREGHPIDFHFDGDSPEPGYRSGGI